MSKDKYAKDFFADLFLMEAPYLTMLDKMPFENINERHLCSVQIVHIRPKGRTFKNILSN